jgi:hypothetical protein
LEEPSVSFFREEEAMWQKVAHGTGNGGYEPEHHVNHWEAVALEGFVLLMQYAVIKEGNK